MALYRLPKLTSARASAPAVRRPGPVPVTCRRLRRALPELRAAATPAWPPPRCQPPDPQLSRGEGGGGGQRTDRSFPSVRVFAVTFKRGRVLVKSDQRFKFGGFIAK